MKDALIKAFIGAFLVVALMVCAYFTLSVIPDERNLTNVLLLAILMDRVSTFMGMKGK